jgi:hypothetical protein
MIFACYRLIENKLMSDGVEIPKDQNLYCIKNEDDILFLLFEKEEEKAIMFWARLEEVTYVCDIEKDFDFNIDDVINGQYFNLI